MLINACLIFYLCGKMLSGEYKEVDWGIAINYFLSGMLEMLFFEAPILCCIGVNK